MANAYAGWRTFEKRAVGRVKWFVGKVFMALIGLLVLGGLPLVSASFRYTSSSLMIQGAHSLG